MIDPKELEGLQRSTVEKILEREALAEAIARHLDIRIREMVRREIALCLGEQKP